ncbi:MAG: hypothetical protein ACW97O_07305 [Candidatus Thorarchaeota archaeon]
MTSIASFRTRLNHPHEIGINELADDPVRGLVEDQGLIHPPVDLGLGVVLRDLT